MKRTNVKIEKLRCDWGGDCARCYSDHGPIVEMLCDYDWRYAFEFAEDFKREDVKRVIAADTGENDGNPWIGLFELENGKYGALSAWCDYTGWD